MSDITNTLIGLGRQVQYFPGLAKCFGDIKVAVFLGQLIYWWPKRTEEGIYKTIEEWEEETFLTEKEQRRVRGILKDRGVIIENYKRLQHRMYYILDEEALNRVWVEYLEGNKTSTPDPTKGSAPNLQKGRSSINTRLHALDYTKDSESNQEKTGKEEPATSSQPTVTNTSGNPDKLRKVELLDVDGEKYPVTFKRVERLKEVYGEKVFMDYVGRVIAYCDSKGKKYKDYAAAAENFMRRDGVQPIKNNPTPLGGDMLPY